MDAVRRAEPLAENQVGTVLMTVARTTDTPIEIVTSAMWDLVDRQRLDYGTDARLRIPTRPDHADPGANRSGEAVGTNSGSHRALNRSQVQTEGSGAHRPGAVPDDEVIGVVDRNRVTALNWNF